MNTFGSASQQFPLYDPASIRENRQRFRRDAIPALSRTNSFYVPTGRYPSRGWILLARSDYNRLDTYSTALQLNIGNITQPGGASVNTSVNVGTLKNLSIVQAQCVTRGLASDPSAIYLVELTDGRGILANQWFQFPITSAYNIRSPAYPQTFHPGSMNGGAGGTTWTWSTMIGDIWTSMAPLLGTYPGLPASAGVSGTPEGFWFIGKPALPVLCEILDHLGLTIACDLTSATSPFTIVDDGASDPVFTALQTRFLTNLEDDQEWIDTGAGRVPKTVKVLFKRRNSIYGTEETVRYDSPYQWDMASFYSVSITAPATFSSASGTHYIWSDFTVRYDQDSNPLSDDVATAATISAERVGQYFDKIYSRTSGYMSQTYAGALPFTTGSQVDGVCWYQNYQDGYNGQSRQGWKTKIVRGPCPPFEEINATTYTS